MTTFGLVHGAWHGGWCWQYVVDELEARGFACVVPDLLVDDASAGLAEYSSTVVDALGDADEVVLVGHSMGSLVIPLVAAARPVRGMVFLCSVPLVPGEPVGPDLVNMVTEEVTAAPHFVDELGRDMYDNATARRVFYHDCSSDLAAWAVSRLRPQGPRPFAEPSPLAAWPEVRSEIVLTDDDRVLNAGWSIGAARRWLGHDPVVLPGSHSPFLSRPAALADALVEASRSLVAPASP
jgi:pimeloyl-ACP methyl ester carboxylesterase